MLLGPSLLQSDEDQVRASVERARNGLAASQLAVTTEGATLALEDALSDVEAALAINPLAADALQLREEIEAVLAELNLVLSPGALTSIAELSRFGPALALGTVRFGGDRAFVLDDAGGRVFSVSCRRRGVGDLSRGRVAWAGQPTARRDADLACLAVGQRNRR